MKRNAFTLFEVIIAIGILTVTVSVVANIQLRSLFHVLRDRDSIEKIFLLKKDVYLALLKPQTKQQKRVNKLENPEITITTVIDNVHPKSSLRLLKDRIWQVRAEGVWKREVSKKTMTMVAFMYKPYQAEKEKR